MTTKDTYTVIKNPNNYVFPFEVWCKGKRKEMTTDGYILDKDKVQRLSAWRSESKAKEVVKYWENLQDFKEVTHGV